MSTLHFVRWALAASLVGGIPALVTQNGPPKLRILMISGGPAPEWNQVAIESNVRYVHRLLPANTDERVLFADGSPETSSVRYRISGDDDHPKDGYRKPQLPRQDGATVDANIQTEIGTLVEAAKKSPKTPVLLYFTGHGSQDPQNGVSEFDLWDPKGHATFQVPELSKLLDQFPKTTPIIVVMVQCHSGGFANLLFRQGDPDGEPADQHICGFFASVQERLAAGCTSAVNEAEYRDFTSYFFSALSGVDRSGKPAPSADYDHNGKIGMDEAYAYALLHDDSIDTPVCTSDAFLRRFVKTSDAEVFKTKYSDIRSWATPAQKAALDGLSKIIRHAGETQPAQAYARIRQTNLESEEAADVFNYRFVRLCKSIVLAHQVKTGSDHKLRRSFDDLRKAEAMNPLIVK